MAILTPGNIAAGFCVVASLLWLGLFVQTGFHRHKLIRLRFLASSEPEGGWPRLDVIVAARDEAATVDRAIRSLLVQDYPAVGVVAVDDRSEDATGTILDALAREDPRLRVVHVESLPDGWLGKTNAMQRGAESTDARWLLFTDADVIFAPGALRRAVSLAEREGIDHLVVGPDMLSETVGERLFLALFTLAFAFKAPLGRIDNPRSKVAIGVGAFNLVRASSFAAIGGLRRIALSVDDDLRLGQALKFAGYRNRLAMSYGDVSVRWQVGLGGLIRGMEKNFFAIADYRVGKAIVYASVCLLLGIGPMLGLFVGPWWTRVICGLADLALAVMLGAASSLNGIGPAYALTMPISGVLVVFALLRSVWITMRRGGVSWRGTFYPLAALRSHVRLRNHWLNEIWHSTR